MSGRLTTHVLDMSRGIPAQGMGLVLFRIVDGESPIKLCESETNADGRLEAPLLSSADMLTGTYELRFYVGDYYRGLGTGVQDVDPMFLEEVPIRFQIGNTEQHYHVPLLVAPGGYSTYRGS
jgi:5-hydroxyisourate hydrolase